MCLVWCKVHEIGRTGVPRPAQPAARRNGPGRDNAQRELGAADAAYAPGATSARRRRRRRRKQQQPARGARLRASRDEGCAQCGRGYAAAGGGADECALRPDGPAGGCARRVPAPPRLAARGRRDGCCRRARRAGGDNVRRRTRRSGVCVRARGCTCCIACLSECETVDSFLRLDYHGVHGAHMRARRSAAAP